MRNIITYQYYHINDYYLINSLKSHIGKTFHSLFRICNTRLIVMVITKSIEYFFFHLDDVLVLCIFNYLVKYKTHIKIRYIRVTY